MSFGRDNAWRYETGDISLRFADLCNIYSTAFLPANWDCEWGEWFIIGQTYLLLTDFRRKEKEKESKRFSLHFKCISFLPVGKDRLSFPFRSWGNIVLVLLTLSLQNSNRSCQIINLFEQKGVFFFYSNWHARAAPIKPLNEVSPSQSLSCTNAFKVKRKRWIFVATCLTFFPILEQIGCNRW